MAKRNYLQIIFVLIAGSFFCVDFCLGRDPGRSRIIEDVFPAIKKMAAPLVASEYERIKKKREIEKELAKDPADIIRERTAKALKEAIDKIKEDQKEVSEKDAAEEAKQKHTEVKAWSGLETRRASLSRQIDDAQKELEQKKDDFELSQKLDSLTEMQRKLDEEVKEKLKSEVAEGGLAGQVVSKKGGLVGIAGLSTVGGMAATLAGPSIPTAFMVAADKTEIFADEDEAGEEVVLEDAELAEEEKDEEEVGEEITGETEPEEKKVVVKKEPKKEPEIVEEVTKGAAGIVAGLLKTAAMATADPETQAKMKAEEKREAEAERKKELAKAEKKKELAKKKKIKKAKEKKIKEAKDKKAKEEKEKKSKEKKIEVEKKQTEILRSLDKASPFVPPHGGTTADKQDDWEKEVVAKKEVLKVITLPKGMKLTPKQSEDFLVAIADHAKKTLKQASRLFAQDEKQKSFTTVSGEVVSVVGQDFSKKYINKYNSELALYKKARDEYKILLKKKRDGEIVDEDKLKSDKRYYLDMKTRARNAFIEKRDEINNYALYYPVNEKGSAWNIIKEGVKIIEEHTPEKFEKIDLLKIFKYLKALGITQRDILPKKMVAEKPGEEEIEKELFAEEQEAVAERLKKEQIALDERLRKEKEEEERLRREEERELKTVAERLRKEQEALDERLKKEQVALEERLRKEKEEEERLRRERDKEFWGE